MRTTWLVVLSGCGRLGFETPHRFDAAGDVTSDDTAQPDAQTICHSASWGTPAVIPALATSSHESDPSLTADELTMFFTGNAGTSQGFAIWTASRATTADAFGSPMLVPELDAAGEDIDPTISADGRTILFASDRMGSGHKMFVAQRANTTDPFGTPVPLTISGASTQVGNSPALTSDGLGLYYALGSINLAFASRATTGGAFLFVRELDELNDPTTDGAPAISDDGLELFFESFRTGSAYVYVATRASTADAFGPPQPLMQFSDDIPGATATGGPEISADGRTLYIFGNTGTIDLYTVTRTCP